jgi:hypothetical protein
MNPVRIPHAAVLHQLQEWEEQMLPTPEYGIYTRASNTELWTPYHPELYPPVRAGIARVAYQSVMVTLAMGKGLKVSLRRVVPSSRTGR